MKSNMYSCKLSAWNLSHYDWVFPDSECHWVFFNISLSYHFQKPSKVWKMSGHRLILRITISERWVSRTLVYSYWEELLSRLFSEKFVQFIFSTYPKALTLYHVRWESLPTILKFSLITCHRWNLATFIHLNLLYPSYFIIQILLW